MDEKEFDQLMSELKIPEENIEKIDLDGLDVYIVTCDSSTATNVRFDVLGVFSTKDKADRFVDGYNMEVTKTHLNYPGPELDEIGIKID